ncbi:MAG: aconitase X catalytic domain-containing protein [Candidatus Verstraetearchaeota archaeon]|nr:aconitase X catalytic domain-containing protein [Candidatus Verstraetearchaeota archaeon]
MFLNRNQELMLKGEFGPAVQKAMELLVALGDAIGAEKLIPIKSVHISGISYSTIGDAGLSFVEDFASLGARATVLSTINPAGMDLIRWREMGVKEDFHSKQLRIINSFKRMNIETTCTCTPYLVGNKPERGSHVSWAESSAVVYGNSILNIKTNRESGPSTIASAITGLTPLAGYHLDENRKPSVYVKLIGVKVASNLTASILGYLIGREMNRGIPAIIGLNVKNLSILKSLSAGLATSGGLAMFTLIEEKGNVQDAPTMKIDYNDINHLLMDYPLIEKPDLIFFGCPHLSLPEITYIVNLLRGRRLKKGMEMWLFTSRHVYSECLRRGYVEVVYNAGGKFICDTCPVVMPTYLIKGRKFITNSSKAAFYLSSKHEVSVSLLDIKTCIKEFTERKI